MQTDDGEYRQGLLYAFLAYVSWGVLPIYFHLVHSIGPIEVVSHRVFWSCLLILLILGFRRELGRFYTTMQDGRVLAALTLSGILIGLNWLTYIWAVLHDHVVAASLAYFLNPLVNVLLGVTFLGERLKPLQWAAIAIAAVGVAILAAGAPQTLYLSLFMAVTFAFYGLVRKLTPVAPLIGLGIETFALLPPALTGIAWTAAHGGLGFGHEVGTTALLIGSGFMTSLPLLLFASAARLLPMVTLGLIQYVTPTMLFFIGVFLYGEPLSNVQLASFALIWTGLALFAGYSLRVSRQAKVAVA
jgi:chloramphenicol-sensitive protein RarD